MRRIACIMILISAVALGACGDDGVVNPPAPVECDPACENGFECFDGACVETNPTEQCDPACEDGSECVDGACVETNPTVQCDPACEDGSECVDGACVETNPEPEANPQCNPYLEGAEIGCEAGQKCVFPEDDSMNTYCTASGTKGFGEACEGVGDCLEGICTSLSGTEQLCYEYCKTSAHCTGGQECLDITDAPYGLCKNDVTFDSCGLLAQDCEDPEKACYVYSGEGPVCLPSGDGVAGDGCSGNSDCSASHTCINGICKSMCDQNAPSPCGGFIPCSGYYGNVGYCDS